MKTVEEIYESLMASFAARAGYTPENSCDLAVRLYAAAAELQALSVQAEWVLAQSFPQTAEGGYLDYHARMRGLTRIPAAAAAGTVRFLVDTPAADGLAVEAGTVCMSAEGARFETTQSALFTAGALFADAPAQAMDPGSGGNVLAGKITLLSACPAGITGCTNPAAFTGGRGAEDDEALRSRIMDSYSRLPNGANAAYYEKIALSHAGAAAAKTVARPRGIGTVDVYVAAPTGAADSALLAEVQSDLQSRREIAVDVQAKAPSTAAVNLSVEIAAADGTEPSTVKAAVERALSGFFTGALLGKPVLLAEIGRCIYGVEGVANYHILTPAADLTASDTVLPVAGTIAVSVMGEA